VRDFLKKHSLIIQLSAIFIVVIINSYAVIAKCIDLSTGISIYAVLIAITVLFISINEIRNRLRPWVAVTRIDTEVTENPNIFYAHFIITNTGPIPASRLSYITKWYIKEESTWKELEIAKESPFESAIQTLFPNQSIRHRSEMHEVITTTKDKDTKVTFFIKYRGLWSRHRTTNTHKFDCAHKVWMPDEPQDYT
jgi:hypothetical protein